MSTITEVISSLEGLNKWFEQVEERISKFEDSEYLVWKRKENEENRIEPHRPMTSSSVLTYAQ